MDTHGEIEEPTRDTDRDSPTQPNDPCEESPEINISSPPGPSNPHVSPTKLQAIPEHPPWDRRSITIPRQEEVTSYAISSAFTSGASSAPGSSTSQKRPPVSFNMKPDVFDTVLLAPTGSLSGGSTPYLTRSPSLPKGGIWEYIKGDRSRSIVSTVRVNQSKKMAVVLTKRGQVGRVTDRIAPQLDDFMQLDSALATALRNEEFETVQVAPPVEIGGLHLKKVKHYFHLVDSNNDGKLSHEEVLDALILSAKENQVEIQDDVMAELADLLMDEADLDGNGHIDFEELASILYSRRKRSGTRMVAPSNVFSSFIKANVNDEDDPIDEIPDRPYELRHWTKGLLYSRIFRQEVWFYLSNNWQQLMIISLWLNLCSLVFVWKFLSWTHKPLYQITGPWLSLSKGSAEVIKLNMAILLLVVCKSTMTYLRSTFLGYFVPFDDRIEFHKLASLMVIFASVSHTFGHLVGNYRKIANAPRELFWKVFGPGTTQPSNLQLLQSPTAISGFILSLVFLVLCFFASSTIRASIKKVKLLKCFGGFEAFWWTHLLLFPAIYVITIYHGSHSGFLRTPTTTTWMYLIAPLILYALEKINRVVLSRTRYSVDVIKAEILPGNVLSLHMSAPFMYKSGMYVYIQVPSISSFEWHPFSITSAPSDFELSIHARAVGDWTTAMLEFWAGEIKKAQFVEYSRDEILVDIDVGNVRYKYPKVLVEGPVGAPAQDYEKYRVAVLVGGGIGVTPFASILRDVIHKTRNRRKYPRFLVEKVYFHWTTREQEAFLWFSDIMEQVADSDDADVIDMCNHLTSAYGDDDPRLFLLKVMQEEYHKKTGVDIITNKKSKILTEFGRPDWESLLSDVLKKHPNTRIGVFVCGASALSSDVQKICRQLTLSSRNGSTFVFRKEVF